ncbi:arogenate dehydrogenase [Clostridium tepidiprofundi DSM 19306]|uniref:Arogenate dehydrogenase n=1 Tax=Clostridium tepidiprofundi DSM 19306 TaxID=1121338 RepID=A0A151B4C4_9CLOT|nr:Rossmann-like and DUF2520 domain-containing protein [Clostridium tepidiprofundi]KYH34755.1 arogenate dehydrogenase [Clostridium tepidiprofundi DSM 19306]
MIIGFIGAGKVGFSLGKYFSLRGIKLSGYYSKSNQSAFKASEFTGSKHYTNIENLIKDSDMIFITTPDDEIYNIWEKISSYNLNNKIICHTSGSLSSKIFSDIDNSEASKYSIHPMFPFSDKYETYKNLKDAYFSIEGDMKNIDKIKALFSLTKNKFFIIDSEKKSLYHLANVVVSNFVLSLIDIGTNYLEKCDFNKYEAIEALMPLIMSNINNIMQNGIENSLTGPIERNDLGTIKHHLDMIPYEDRELYKILSLNLIDISEKKHEDRNYKELKDYLRRI